MMAVCLAPFAATVVWGRDLLPFKLRGLAASVKTRLRSEQLLFVITGEISPEFYITNAKLTAFGHFSEKFRA
jgi:hypothetical protein